jgi:hypothetical protein
MQQNLSPIVRYTAALVFLGAAGLMVAERRLVPEAVAVLIFAFLVLLTQSTSLRR